MNKKKNLLILGGNSKKNINWMKKMQEIYSLDYNVNVIEYDNWYFDKRISFEDELNKISNIIKKDEEYIIVAKSIGILLSVMAIKRKIVNPKLVVFMGVPLKFLEEENLELLDSLMKIRKQVKMLLIQQENDPQCSFKKLESRLNNKIPLISVKGNDHAYNEIKSLKKYIDEFIKLNTNNEVKVVNGNNMNEVIRYIDKNRKNYKYYNNWLSDANNKILIFDYEGFVYIAKRTSKKKALKEIENAKILKGFFESNNIGKFKYVVNIPLYYGITRCSGYLVAKYYGADFNQSFYNNMQNEISDLDGFVKDTFQLLMNNDIRYNGFIPRNVIFNNGNVFLIDFEDINQKSNIAVETTVKIAWSYFLKSSFSKNLEYDFSFEDKFATTFKKYNLNEYLNPYYVALVAESFNKDNLKMDDVINTLSPYLSMEMEVLLDIILYEVSIGNFDCILKEKLASLSQVVRVLELVEKKSKIKSKIDDYINDILIDVKKSCNSLSLKSYIEYLLK